MDVSAQMTVREFTQNWLFDVPAREQHLARFRDRPVRALEIGSFEGRSACWLMDNILTHPDATLDCVDPHSYPAKADVDSESRREISICYADPQPLRDVQQRFLHNLRTYGERCRYHAIPSRRFFAERTGERPFYSIAYVDGMHSAIPALEDLLGTWRLLRVDDVLVFDDVGWKGYGDWRADRQDEVPADLVPCDGPRRAWDAFLRVVPTSDLELLHEGWTGIARKLQ